LSALEPALLPREPEAGSPVFAVPWHAEALGIANALIQSGMYSPLEWSETLAAEIRSLAASGEPDTEEIYYQAVLAAVERLVDEKSPETGASLVDRVEAWRRAYLNTPHGRPVTLAAAAGSAVDAEPAYHGDHHHAH
jgi:nitrile hydratase accessory protein